MEMTKTDRDEFLDGVIITAVEGGIGYWSVCHSYKWRNRPEVIAVIQETDGDGEGFGDKITLDRDMVRKGIKEILSGETNVGSYLTKMVAAANATNDGCELDADGADAIIQVACFGNLVYG